MADSKKYNGSTWEHSLRKLGTSTDTITTLPADLYADGNNATVGLKGNMQQTGTPTPQNPIQPTECGELETSGAKAGQYKIPISSANTTTPVYLGEVQTTRKIKKLVLDGTENWQTPQGTTYIYYLIITDMKQYGDCMSNTFQFTQKNTSTSLNDGEFTSRLGIGIAIWFKHSASTTTSDWKTYLQQQYTAGTPVCVWYVLETPETAVVNEPLRKIGDYADTVSGITIPTITGKDSFDVLTTFKPSEVSLSYTGWHDASVKEWDGSEWQ